MNFYPCWVHRIPEMMEALALAATERIDLAPPRPVGIFPELQLIALGSPTAFVADESLLTAVFAQWWHWSPR